MAPASDPFYSPRLSAPRGLKHALCSDTNENVVLEETSQSSDLYSSDFFLYVWVGVAESIGNVLDITIVSMYN